jgi:DNA polymerase alpha subunit B
VEIPEDSYFDHFTIRYYDYIALDDRIDAFAEMYRRSYPDTVFRNPAYPSQSVVTVVGRICSDANEGKANEQSLLLETSRSIGNGSRVKLDIMEVQGYNFFPGQIVVLSGLNSHGSIFAVTRVHEVRSNSRNLSVLITSSSEY